MTWDGNIKFEQLTFYRERDGLEFILADTQYSQYVLTSKDWGQVTANISSQRLNAVLGYEDVWYSVNRREMMFEGYCVASSKFEIASLKKRLNSYFIPGEKYILHYLDKLINVVSTSSIKYDTTYDVNNEVMCKFVIQCSAPIPYFKSQVINSKTVFNDRKWSFETSIPNAEYNGFVFSIVKESTFFTIENKGDIEAGFLCSITFSDAFTQTRQLSLKIDDKTFCNFKFDGSLSSYYYFKAKDKVVFSSIVGDEYVYLYRLDANNEYQPMDLMPYIDEVKDNDNYSGIFRCPQGDTVVYFETGDNAEVSVNVVYENLYVEVEE